MVSFSQSVSLMPDLAQGIAALEEVGILISQENSIDPSLDPFQEGKYIGEIKGEIEFRNVDFVYFSGRAMFSKLNLTIPAGKTVTILGTGGTTLIDLILKFYNVDDGELVRRL